MPKFGDYSGMSTSEEIGPAMSCYGDETLKAAVTIDAADLNDEYVKLSANLAYYGAKHADSHRVHLVAKFELERVEAATRIRIRECAPVKMTVDDVNARVSLDDDYVTARLTCIGAESDELAMKNVLNSIQAKKDMLVSIGAQVRAEMGADPSLRRRVADQKDVERGGSF